MANIQKISSIIFTIIAVLSIVFFGLYFLGGSVPETVGTQFEAKNFTSLVLVWAVILFVIAALATLLFSFANIFTNPKAIKGFLVALGVAVVLFVVSYLLSSSAPINIDTVKDTSASTMKWVGTGLNATYILAIVAFVGIIASEVMRAFK